MAFSIICNTFVAHITFGKVSRTLLICFTEGKGNHRKNGEKYIDMGTGDAL